MFLRKNQFVLIGGGGGMHLALSTKINFCSGSKAASLINPSPNKSTPEASVGQVAMENRLFLSPTLPILSGCILPCMAAKLKTQRTVICRDFRHYMQMYNHLKKT